MGWMVTRKEPVEDHEGGRGLGKAGKLPHGILRVWFLDEKHGFAVGAKKTVFETTTAAWNGSRGRRGRTQDPRRLHRLYAGSSLRTRRNGIIAGFSRPPRRDEIRPAGLGESRDGRRPARMAAPVHHAGDARWRQDLDASTASLFGQITRIRLSPSRSRAGTDRASPTRSEWPSEVFRMDWKTGKSTRVYRDHNRRITDLACRPTRLPTWPGRRFRESCSRRRFRASSKCIKSTDLETWTEMEVDYRATAPSARAGGAGREQCLGGHR